MGLMDIFLGHSVDMQNISISTLIAPLSDSNIHMQGVEYERNNWG